MTWRKTQSRHLYEWLPNLIIVMTIVVLLVGVVTLYSVQDRMVTAAGEGLARTAFDIADKLDLFLFERYSDIQTMTKVLGSEARGPVGMTERLDALLGTAPSSHPRDPATMTQYLMAMKKANPDYLWLAVTDAQGRTMASTSPASVGKDRSDHQWFQAVRRGAGLYVGDVEVPEGSGGIWAVAFAAPIKSPQGKFLGAVTARVGLPVLEKIFTRRVHDFQARHGAAGKVEYQLLTPDGKVIADSALPKEGGNEQEQAILKHPVPPSIRLAESGQTGYVEEVHPLRRVQVVTGYAQTKGHGTWTGLRWMVLVRMDRSDILAPINTVLWKLSVGGGLPFITLLSILWWMTGRLRKEWAQAQEESARATAAEAKLRASEKQTRLIIDTAYDAFIAMDAQGVITDWNPQAEKIFGWSRDEALGRVLSDTIIPLQHRQAHQRGLRRFLTTGEGPVLNKRIEITALRREGTEFPVELSIRPLKAGESYTFNAFIADITERKRAEAELQQAIEAAEAANRAKSDFLANMSHEIRTPMNAIIGIADLLWESPLTSEQKKYVHISRSAGENLLKLINDILDLSKVEAGHLDLEELDFDLAKLVEKTLDFLAIRAHQKGLKLTCSVSPDVSTSLRGDPDRLQQILVNLLGNAIKFTETGEVALQVKNDPDGQEAGMLLFTVSDTGIGIPPDKVDVIFESFMQLDSPTTHKHVETGTGLGLAITKRLVELMGGRIWAESRVGHGSTFSFTARFGIQTETAQPVTRPSIMLKGLKALVVDDNATTRFIIREMLAARGTEITEAAGGQEALAELKRAQEAATPYQLLLLDCHMPDLNGFQVAECIKNTPGLAGTTMLMLTSDARDGDLARARGLGSTGYLVKPINRADLLHTITAALSHTQTTAQTATEATGPAALDAQRPLNILLVEDSADNRVLIQAYLKQTSHQLEIAENGARAVEKFQAGRFDLVLMDMQLPVMDGYTATKTIRQWEQTQNRQPTPIIALTAYALKEEAQKSLQAGCMAHLTKPIKKAALLAAIAEYAKRTVNRPVAAGECSS